MQELRAFRSPSIIGTLKRYLPIPLPFASIGECIASSASIEQVRQPSPLPGSVEKTQPGLATIEV